MSEREVEIITDEPDDLNQVEGPREYPLQVIGAVNSIRGLIVTLQSTAGKISEGQVYGAPDGAMKMSYQTGKMLQLCDEITRPTDKNEEERAEVIRELWNSINLTPKLSADAFGFSVKEMAAPKNRYGTENAYAGVLAKLGKASGDIQNVMNFQSIYKTTRSLKIDADGAIYAGGVGATIVGVCVAQAGQRPLLGALSFIPAFISLVYAAFNKKTAHDPTDFFTKSFRIDEKQIIIAEPDYFPEFFKAAEKANANAKGK